MNRDAEMPLAFSFDADLAHSPGSVEVLLGGKGAGLAAMTAMGLPVPPGFTLSTAACRRYLDHGWDNALEKAVRLELSALEERTGKKLGCRTAPLLVSVRSGAPVSMPGMMDTVLNVGMTAEVAAGLSELTGDEQFASDTYRRALLSFAEVVGVAPDEVLTRARAEADIAALLRVLGAVGLSMPADPVEQVLAAVRAVFQSWLSDRAQRYREVEDINAGLGTAATIQAMVFGNLGDDSGTGVAFTRDPSTGEPGLMGDFLVGSQGEDVVAGGHVTRPLSDMRARWPEAWRELTRIADLLEGHYRDMVDIEFTVEQGQLWMLQARRGKRSPLAVFRTAVDMAEDPDFPVDRAEAVERCRSHLAHPPTVGDDLDDHEVVVIGSGLAAAPGRAVGVLCLDADEAVALESTGEDVVLVRRETSPADVHGIAASVGIVTTLGGLVSHAAVVARSWGLPAIVGASELQLVEGAVVGPGGRVEAGMLVTVDGDRGRLLEGAHVSEGTLPSEVMTIRRWAAALSSPDRHVVAATLPADRVSTALPDASIEFVVFHALRIKGLASPRLLASMTALDSGVLQGQLEALVARGFARHIEARGLWQLTREGREHHASALADAAASIDLDSLQYDEFLGLNSRFKELCTDWQLRDGELNDHHDESYDAKVIDRLVGLDAEACPIVASFADVVPWTAPYVRRLAEARQRVVSGDSNAFTGVMCDSYHDVWMELHEDLILTQGIDRAAEGST